MKAIFVGGGAGCRDVLDLFLQGQLAILDLEIAFMARASGRKK